MPADFTVTGADDFQRLSKALKAAGRGTMRRDLNRALRTAAKPVIKETQGAFAAALPARLKSKGQGSKQTVKVSTGRDPGVQIVVSYRAKAGRGFHGSNARLANEQGIIRHPLFGNREVFYSTPVPAARGWFDDTLRENAPDVRPHLERAIRDIERRIIREAGL